MDHWHASRGSQSLHLFRRFGRCNGGYCTIIQGGGQIGTAGHGSTDFTVYSERFIALALLSPAICGLERAEAALRTFVVGCCTLLYAPFTEVGAELA